MKFITYGAYVYIPALAVIVWTADLLGLLLWWLVADDGRKYKVYQADIAFISNIGAAHKSFFIAMNALVWFLHTLSLFCERWLRHVDRIPRSTRSREKIFDNLALLLAFVAGGCLTFLAIFDCVNHGQAHWSLTVAFIVCVALSAIFQTLEVHAMARDYPRRNHLKRNRWIKLGFVALAIISAVCFAGFYASDKSSMAAIFEWITAIFYDFYLATFILDLWPAAKSSPRHLRRQERKSFSQPPDPEKEAAPEPGDLEANIAIPQPALSYHSRSNSNESSSSAGSVGSANSRTPLRPY